MNSYLWCVKLSLLAIILLAGCKEPGQSLFRVPLQQAIDHPALLKEKDWMDSITYIPLETNDSCYIGDVYKIIYQNDQYYIRDLSGNLYVFTDKGKFVRKVGRAGRGSEEYTFLCDFTVDPTNGDVYVVSPGEIVVYGADGRFLRKMKMDSELQVVTFDAANHLVFIAPVAPRQQDTFYLLNVLSREGQLVRKITGDHADCELAYFNWIQEQEGKVYFKQEFSDTLCYMDKSLNIHPCAVIDLGNYRLTPDILSLGKANKWPEYYRVDGAFGFKNTLVLNVQEGLQGKELSTCFFNKETGKAYLGKKKEGYQGFLMGGVCYCPRAAAGNQLICTISASDLWENESIQQASLQEIAGHLNENANPVLAVCAMK